MLTAIKACLLTTSFFFVSIPPLPPLPRNQRPVIDPLPDFFPLDEESSVGIELSVVKRKSRLVISSKVTELEEKKYLYKYVMTNDGEYPVAVRYSIFDQLTGTEVMLIYLEPGKSRTVTVESGKMPVYVEGAIQVWLMVKPDDEIWKEDIKKAGATVSGDFFHPVNGKIRGPFPFDK